MGAVGAEGSHTVLRVTVGEVMNQFVVANANDCIGCRSCEIACVLSHNGGRYPDDAEAFHPCIHVVTDGARVSATTCRHCEDAPCLNVCLVGAITRKSDGIYLNKAKCTGCKRCVQACPFGAIQMVPKKDTASGHGKAQAHKCNLCQDHEKGPACIQACPTRALHLLDEQLLDKQRQKKQQRTAGEPAESKMPYIHRLTPLLDSLPHRPRQEAAKSPLELRKTTFVETYQPFSSQQVSSQAERCLRCSDRAVCEWTCPLHNDIPKLLELAKQGRIEEAAELSHQTSSLPEVCGRICPQDRLCEGHVHLRQNMARSPLVMLSVISTIRRWQTGGSQI
ncbi:4Fe-4S dicluster domain-containing protein [Dongshaea marina]|uniref:4Fe-4S dicluster domain-containing protein n=1 Tax=Dongshaea marina TaxID=2047966 RepID=UPI0038990213